MQKYAMSASECIRMGQNGWSPGSRFVILWHCIQGMLLWQLVKYGTSGQKRVVRRKRVGAGPHNVTRAWDDRHLVRMAMMDRTDSSTMLSQRWSTATGLDLSASTVHHHLLRAGLVDCMPLHRLPLSRDHQHLRMQWARERCHWCAEWRNVVFSESPASTCPTIMAAYVFNAMMLNTIWESAFFSGNA